MKPVSLPLYWLIRDAAVRVIELPFAVGIVVLISCLFRYQPILAFTAVQAASFLAFAIIAMLFHYFLFTAVAMIGFWLDHTWGERFVLNVIIEVASGALIPLSFFPAPWGALLHRLPFSVLVAKPVEALLGMGNFWWPLVGACAWLALSIAGTHFLLQRGLRRYAGEGI